MSYRWGFALVSSCAVAACAAAPGEILAPPAETPMTPATVVATGAAPSAAVADAPPLREDVGPVILPPHPAADLFADLPTGDEQRARLCARGHTDRLAEVFCADPPPVIESLVDLQRAIGLAYVAAGLPEHDNVTGNGREGNPAFVFSGHTTSLTARLTSPINPRAIVFSPPAHTARSANLAPHQFVKDPRFVAMTFTRGEQIVELIDRDPKTGDLRFFVVRFEQACNDRPEGCSSHELFGPAVERDWKRVTIYDDGDLENTPADCNVCHQPNGHGTPRVLLMQAIQTPWTHFFRRNREGGQININLYQAAHDRSEAYGGIPGSEIPYSDPALLEGLVENEGFMKQPITLHAEAIVQEIAEKGLADQPVRSLAWQLEFKRALKGDIPGVAYPVVDLFDGERMGQAAKAYRAVLAGRAEADQAPYLGDLHRLDVLFRVGLAPKPEAGGREIMANVCRRCHNAKRNPKLTRARFDVDALERLSVPVLERARHRLTLPIDSPQRMPPARFGRLSDEETARVQSELARLIEAKGGRVE